MSPTNHDPNRPSQKDGGDWSIPTDDLPPPPSHLASRGDFADLEAAPSTTVSGSTSSKTTLLALVVAMGLVLSLGIVGFLFIMVAEEDLSPTVIGEVEAEESVEVPEESAHIASNEVPLEESVQAPESEAVEERAPAPTRPPRPESEPEQPTTGDRSQAELTFGSPEVEGNLDTEAVTRVLNRHRREQLFCYESGSRGTGQKAGTLTLSLIISDLGGVVAASTRESTLNSRNIEDCLVGRARRWTFPEPLEGVVRVDVPLVFAPASPQ